MDDFRNCWIHLHHNRLVLHSSIHFSPFNALNEDVNEVIYAGVLTPESIIKAWKDWWNENRDKPFHLVYLQTRNPRGDIPGRNINKEAIS